VATQFAVDLVFKSQGVNNIQAFERQLQGVQTAAKGAQGSMNAAATGAQGLGAAIGAALGPLLSVAAALGVVKKGLDTAFERSAAEQRIRNITDSTGEFNAAMALASQSAAKFGLSQTEATKALADVYSRLKGVGFGLQETGQIYDGFNAIAKQSGLAAEEASGAFFQLSQALGKGKLNGDEFVIIAERMPQLLDAIAQTTGKSRGELQAMAQDGKITSQVLYEALSGAAAASEDLNGKLTAQQKAMNQLGQVADQLLNTIGQVFAPVVIAGAEGLAAAGQMLADWWGYIGGVVFPKVYEAIKPVINELQYAFKDFDFEPFRVFLQGILIKGFQVLTSVVAGFAKVLAQVINAFRALIQNPVFKFIAEQVGRLVNHLGLATDKVGEFKSEQEGTKQAAAETVKEYSGLPEKIDDGKEAAKQLKKAQEEVTNQIQETVKAIDQQAQAQATAVDQALSVTQARLQAEQAINQVLLDQAQGQLQAATSQQERVAIAKRIYDLTVAQAQLELQSTKATIAAELEKARLAVSAAQLKAKEVEAVVKLAIAQKTVTQAHFEALRAQQEAVGLAQRHLSAAEQVASAQLRAADATYQGKVQAANAAYQANVLAKNTQSAAGAAGQFANEMQRGAQAAQAAASSVAAAANGVTAVGVKNGPLDAFGAAAQNAAFRQRWSDFTKEFNANKGSVSSKERLWWDTFNRFMREADAYNKNKGREAMASANEDWKKYSGGGTTEQTVNITTGPVVQMDGTNFVKQDDFTKGVQDASRQASENTLRLLERDPAVRRRVGLAR
jgi:tape measure domain-containing protein